MGRKDVLLVPASDDTNATASYVPESNMESAELVTYVHFVSVTSHLVNAPSQLTNDKQHAIGLLRVFYLRQEVGGETEGQRHLRRLVEVCLQNGPIRLQC